MLCLPIAARAQTADAFNPGANQIVYSMAIQPDGKIVVGGGFTGLGGGTGTTVRNHIGRLNADGTVDPIFNPGANSIVQAVAVQADGKILIGGNFTSVGGGNGLLTARNRLARFNSDGSVDASFNPGANLNVYALVVQPDGKILVGGEFSTIGGGGSGTTARSRLARLNPDGSVDAFNPGASKLPMGASAIVYTMALQPDGKVVVGGYFNGLGGGTGATVRNYLGRLNADGSVDTGFSPGASFTVNAVALQADGKIIVGGNFTGLGGGTGVISRANIGRLESDGQVDLAFNPGVESQVNSLAVQTDGRILAGGYFKWMGAAGGPSRSERNYVGRLNVDGSVDAGFNPGANNVVNALAMQPDGAIVVGGVFLSVGSPNGNGTAAPRSYIARFPAGAAVQTLTLSGGGSAPSSMAWARGGAGPEVSSVTFEFSFDGSFYSLLGSGTRVTGGWQLNNAVNLPRTRRVWLRARGYYGTGFQNGSGSIVESIFVQMPLTTRAGDYDGDGRADYPIFRPSSGQWWIQETAVSGSYLTRTWGSSGDIPVPGDYDGDGKTDTAIYRPSDGFWWAHLSASQTYTATQWGTGGDIPVPADYDGDGKADIAVFRPSDGTWYIAKSSTTFTTWVIFMWGAAGDVPVPGDYDGDGKADVAIYRPSNGSWWVSLSATQGYSTTAWGTGGDIPVPADYDGDGKTDVGVFRPSSGTWFIANSSGNPSVYVINWGQPGDVPAVQK